MKIGDRVTHLDGLSIDSWDEFRWAVQERLPGTKIAVRIERGAMPADDADEDVPNVRVLDLELELGSAALLRDPVTGRQSDSDIMRARVATAKAASVRFGAPPHMIELDQAARPVVERVAPKPKRQFEVDPKLSEHVRPPGE